MDGVLTRILALQANLPLIEFCERVGLSYEKMKKCFQRNALTDSQTLSKIADHYQIDLQWLVAGKGPSSRLNVQIAKKIMEYRTFKKWTLEEMAARVSLTPQVLEMYETGKCALSTDIIQGLCKKLRVSPVEWLLDGRDRTLPELKIYQAPNTRANSQINHEDYVSIPLTDSAIAAGQPIIAGENIEDYVLLHVRAAKKRNNLVATRVDGDSMEPMLHSGDIVVIDRNDRTIVRNKIFAIFHDNGMTAKYLERKKHLLILRPINPTAEVQIIDLNENTDPIVGRIIGAWKEL